MWHKALQKDKGKSMTTAKATLEENLKAVYDEWGDVNGKNVKGEFKIYGIPEAAQALYYEIVEILGADLDTRKKLASFFGVEL